jgi:hypothetical protein
MPKHPIRGISGAKPRVLPSIRQILAEEAETEAQKRKERKERKSGARKSAQ